MTAISLKEALIASETASRVIGQLQRTWLQDLIILLIALVALVAFAIAAVLRAK